jgi:uncharacterized LabA/DUF88 family protein
LAEDRLKIAVFVDFDNIEIGVRNTLNRSFDMAAVLDAIKERGEIVTKIAYGDWKRSGDYGRTMGQHAIHMVQRNMTPGGDKNGADINLALDALEMAFTRDHINAFVIVSGDSDFITLVEKLKQYDKKVFVVGGRAFTSGIMQRNCHEFIAYENVIRTQSSGRRPVGRSRSTNETPVEKAIPLIRRALTVLNDREVSPQLGLLKSTLLQLDSTFSERDYGATTFRAFIEKLARTKAVSLKQVDRSLLVELNEDFTEDAGSEDADDKAKKSTSPRNRSPRAVAPACTPKATAETSSEAASDATSESSSESEDTGDSPRSSRTSRSRVARTPESEESPAEAPPRMEEGIQLIRSVFEKAEAPLKWPMYVRGVKQFIKAAEPDFDERAYGFSGLLDALRQVQKAGVLRLERNRQGVLRIFPGEEIERSEASVQESLVESSGAGATLSDTTESVAGDDKAVAQAGVEAGVGDDKAPIVATKTTKTTKKAVAKKKVTATKKATAVKKKTTRKTTKKVAKKETAGSEDLEVDGNK